MFGPGNYCAKSVNKSAFCKGVGGRVFMGWVIVVIKNQLGVAADFFAAPLVVLGFLCAVSRLSKLTDWLICLCICICICCYACIGISCCNRAETLAHFWPLALSPTAARCVLRLAKQCNRAITAEHSVEQEGERVTICLMLIAVLLLTAPIVSAYVVAS